ncbi:HAD-superfamily hydrolase [Paraconexibacter sp. AEG42_29]|uniref:HAD-superfamily hydrolase n=1 Tax=Paraconexibacter sp. AEG42_29 TaxID=2997339 RepID=A0AAU7AWP0_9ACTN
MRIRGVVFDLDDTLTDHRGLEIEIWAEACASIVAAHPEVEPDLLTVRHRGNLERFYEDLLHRRFDLAAFQRARLTHALEPWGIAPSDELIDTYVRHKKRFEREVWAGPNAEAALRATRAAGLRIGVLTNGEEAGQRAKLAMLGLATAPDAFVTSEAAGAPKPSKVPFAAVASALGLDPGELAMVGDSVRNDIHGALDAGFAAAVLVRPLPDGLQELPAGALVADDAHAALAALGLTGANV